MDMQVHNRQDENQNSPAATVKNVKYPTGLVVFLILLVISLFAFVAFAFFTDRLDIGIENPLSKNVEEETNRNADENNVEEASNIDDEKTSEKMGQFKINMGYASEFLPASRICFTDTSDDSKVYCFVDKGTSPDSNTYANQLENGVGNLPVGKYIMEYNELGMYGSGYVWNPCIKELNGSEVIEPSKCTKVNEFLSKSYKMGDWMNFKVLEALNAQGGDPIVITIEEGKVSNIGDVAIVPYFSFDTN